MARKKRAPLRPLSRPPGLSDSDWNWFQDRLKEQDAKERKRRARYRKFPQAEDDDWLNLVLIILEDARQAASRDRKLIAEIEEIERTIRNGSPWKAAIGLVRVSQNQTFADFWNIYGKTLDSVLTSHLTLRRNRHVPSRDPEVQDYIARRGRELLRRGRDRRELAGIIHREMQNNPPELRRSIGTIRRALKAAGL